jgi:hypothetical protein
MEVINKIYPSPDGKYIGFCVLNKILIFFKDDTKYIQVYPIQTEVPSFVPSCFWTKNGSLFVFTNDEKMLIAYNPIQNLRYTIRF